MPAGRVAVLFATIAGLVGQPLCAQQISREPVAHATASQGELPPSVLPRGTEVALQLVSPLSSRHSEVGDRFHLQVAIPIMIDGRLLVSSGARAVGEVVAAETKGVFGRPGSLTVRLLHMLVGTQLVPLEGKAERVGDDPDERAGLVVAAIILTPFLSGRSADFPPGTEVAGRVSETVLLRASAGLAREPQATQESPEALEAELRR